MNKSVSVTVLAALLLLGKQPEQALAAPNVENQPEVLFTRDMTEQEVDTEIRKAMPFPVISILFAVKNGKRHFAVNMRLPKAIEPVFHVNWHVPISADRGLMLRSIRAASEYAKVTAGQIQRTGGTSP